MSTSGTVLGTGGSAVNKTEHVLSSQNFGLRLGFQRRLREKVITDTRPFVLPSACKGTVLSMDATVGRGTTVYREPTWAGGHRLSLTTSAVLYTLGSVSLFYFTEGAAKARRVCPKSQ